MIKNGANGNSGTVRISSDKPRKTYISALMNGQMKINTVKKLVGVYKKATNLI